MTVSRKHDDFDREGLRAVVDKVLSLAKQMGASAAEVDVSTGSGFSVTARKGEVETLEHDRDKGVGVTVYYGQRTGTANTSDLSAEAIHTTVEKASHIARYTSEDPCAGLADEMLMAKHQPELDLYHPWHIRTDEAIALAKQVEAVGLSDSRITNTEGATLSTHQYFHIYGNSYGFRGEYPTSRHSVNCSFIAEKNSAMQRDYDYTVARDAEDLEELSVVGKRAAERTVHRLGAKQISTRQCPVIFAADIASGLLGCFISAISGGNLYRKSSFLLDHIDKQIFPETIRIDERPHLPKALGSAPFDAEGVETKPRDIIKDGILQGYVLSSYSARQLGLTTTGNAGGIHNLFISTSDMDLPALLKHMDTGLLVTELIGQGINIVTGDYSRGAFGYWIEKGEIQHPVHEITIAGNLKDMFMNISAIGNDIDHRSSIHTGSILLNNMMIAGV